jgi:hypothetical protein
MIDAQSKRMRALLDKVALATPPAVILPPPKVTVKVKPEQANRQALPYSSLRCLCCGGLASEVNH